MTVSDAEPARLVVMAKEPVPGKVKTRLVPPLSEETAARLYEAFLLDVLDYAAAGASESPLEMLCFVTPDSRSRWFRKHLPGAWRFRTQSGDDLAQRMVHCFGSLFEEGPAPVVMRNSDSPTLPRSLVSEAVTRLQSDQADLVLGPDRGGGYYLVGLRTPRPELFEGVTMSTASMHEETVRIATDLGLRVHELPQWLDVDNEADLRALEEELQGDAEAWSRCPRTVRLLEELDAG